MIDLKQFCGHGDPREFLNRPWQEDGATYATNGHIGIRLDVLQEGIEPAHPTMAGRIDKMLTDALANTIPLEIKFPTDAPKPCGHCAGGGRINARTCEECDGGSFIHGSHSYDCKECVAGEIHTPASNTAAGAETCWVCDGHGIASRRIYLNANGVQYCFQEKYLRSIHGLPRARLFVSGDSHRVARFDFDGGRGLLMPMQL